MFHPVCTETVWHEDCQAFGAMRQLLCTIVAGLIAVFAGWSAAHINATTAPLNPEALGASIANEIKRTLGEDLQLRDNPLEVIVEVDRERVTISGLVNSETLRRQALHSVAKARKDYSVRDQIVVSLPRAEFTAALGERQRAVARAAGAVVGTAIDDAWIHSDLSARLRTNPATANQSALLVDVVNGKVTLRGLVSLPEQKIVAGQVAADTQGVTKVNIELRSVVDSGKRYRISVG